MPKYQDDPCESGLCKGKCSTGRVAPGPMLARSLPPYHTDGTSRRRSSAQNTHNVSDNVSQSFSFKENTQKGFGEEERLKYGWMVMVRNEIRRIKGFKR